MSHQPASTALSRFTVLDLTRVRAGPTAVRQLADWGANVIKILSANSPRRSGEGIARAMASLWRPAAWPEVGLMRPKAGEKSTARRLPLVADPISPTVSSVRP